MPRARLPDARSLATADSPILPFLAPRVFAESPFRRRNGGVQKCAQEEEAGKDAASNAQTVTHTFPWRGAHTLRNHTANSLPTSSLSRAPPSRPMAPAACLPESRYADIFFLARQLCAGFSTKSDPGKKRTGSNQRKRLTQKSDAGAVQGRRRKQDSYQSSQIKSYKVSWKLSGGKFQRGIRRGNLSASSKVQEEPQVSVHSAKKGSTAAKAHMETPLQRLRRIRTLRSVYHRLSFLRSSLEAKSIHGNELMRDGRFRSLYRRQYVLSRGIESHVYPGFGHSKKRDYFPLVVRGFAALDSRVYPGLNRKSHRIILRHDPQCADLAIELCHGVVSLDVETMWLNWNQFDEAKRISSWQQLLLFLLHKRPHHALSFIRVLMREPRMSNVRAQLIADSLEHMARLFLQNDVPKTLIGTQAYFLPTFYYCFRDHFVANRNVCSQDLLWNVARLADSSEQLRLIFDLLVEKKAYMGYDTLLHYANRFGELADSEYAWRCLQKVVDVTSTPQGKADVVNRKRFRWSCASILRNIVKMSIGQDYHLTTSVVAEFLKMGVKLDILLYNVIMRNAMDAGDYTTAFRVFNLLEDNGIEPDSYTFSILLHGCTVTGDPAKFHDFAEHCATRAKEMSDPYLAATYLHYLYVRHYDEEPVLLSGIMRRAYSQFFSQGALLSLIPINRPRPPTMMSSNNDFLTRTESDTVTSEDALMEPSGFALYIMLQSAIRKSVSLGTNYVFKLYEKFKRAVTEKHHLAINELALKPIIWNAFLLAFCQKQQFADASQLLKSMTEGDRALFPQPNVYSYNIFMQAFFKNDQSRAAERIYEIMRSRGVEPDQFTFGTLLRGFARTQLVDKIGDVMKHVEDEAELHPHVLRDLARAHDRKRLMLELEKARIAKERKLRAKLITERDENERIWKNPVSSSSELASTPSSVEQEHLVPIFSIQKYTSGKKK